MAMLQLTILPMDGSSLYSIEHPLILAYVDFIVKQIQKEKSI